MHASYHSTTNNNSSSAASSSGSKWSLTGPHRRLTNLISTWCSHSHVEEQLHHHPLSDNNNNNNDDGDKNNENDKKQNNGCGGDDCEHDGGGEEEGERQQQQQSAKKLHYKNGASFPLTTESKKVSKGNRISTSRTSSDCNWMMGQKNEKTRAKEGVGVARTGDEEGGGGSSPALQLAATGESATVATAMSASADEEARASTDGTFVNVGLKRWERERAAWRGSSKTFKNGSGKSSKKKSSKSSKGSSTTTRPLEQSHVDEVIDIIFSNRWRAGLGGAGGFGAAGGGMGMSTSASSSTGGNGKDDKKPEGTFPVSVPLPRMIDILVDLWEAEGMEA